MAEYIDRQAVIDAVNGNPYVTESVKAYVRTTLMRQPSADVVEVLHGRWEPYADMPIAYDIFGDKTWAKRYRCMDCGFIHTFIQDHGHYAYCPNCGARMGW